MAISRIETRGAVNDPYHFLPRSHELVVLQGEYRQENLWLFDLDNGNRRQLTNLKAGFSVTGFDIAVDGKQVMFDRVRQNADIVLIDFTR
jgi:hypothetical protein